MRSSNRKSQRVKKTSSQNSGNINKKQSIRSNDGRKSGNINKNKSKSQQLSKSNKNIKNQSSHDQDNNDRNSTNSQPSKQELKKKVQIRVALQGHNENSNGWLVGSRTLSENFSTTRGAIHTKLSHELHNLRNEYKKYCQHAIAGSPFMSGSPPPNVQPPTKNQMNLTLRGHTVSNGGGGTRLYDIVNNVAKPYVFILTNAQPGPEYRQGTNLSERNTQQRNNNDLRPNGHAPMPKGNRQGAKRSRCIVM